MDRGKVKPHTNKVKDIPSPAIDGYPVTSIQPKNTTVRGCGAAVKGNKYRK